MTDSALKSSDVLLRSRDAIMDRGHCKGRFSDDEGRVCARGALLLAIGSVRSNGEPGYWGVHDIWFWNAEAYLKRHLGLDDADLAVPVWNNAPERTADDVLDAFFEAAILAKEDGN